MTQLGISVALSLLALVGLASNVLGLPGNWLVVIMAAACWWFFTEESANSVGLPGVITILSAAALGELLEFLAGALGAQRVGGTRRGTVLAIGGSMVGAIAGLLMGTAVPIPIVGNLVASLLLGGMGAFAGAIVGERWAGKDWDTAIQVGSSAFWGRLLGTVAKSVCGTIACGVFLLAIWW